jgi:hypothetical protein
MSIASVGLCVYQQPGISYQKLFKKSHILLLQCFVQSWKPETFFLISSIYVILPARGIKSWRLWKGWLFCGCNISIIYHLDVSFFEVTKQGHSYCHCLRDGVNYQRALTHHLTTSWEFVTDYIIQKLLSYFSLFLYTDVPLISS